MDVLGIELNEQQKTGLAQLHRLCELRMKVKLPDNINSPRCDEYEQVQRLDATIEEHAPSLKLQYVKVAKSRNPETGLMEETKEHTPVREDEAARIVWQYYFIANPYRFH
jgi:hypothetical protein